MQENVQAVEETTVEEVLVDRVVVSRFEDRYVVERHDSDGNVLSDDPVADVTMLDELEKAVALIKEKIEYIKARNAAFEGHMLAIQELQRQQAAAMAQAQAEAEKVEMPE